MGAQRAKSKGVKIIDAELIWKKYKGDPTELLDPHTSIHFTKAGEKLLAEPIFNNSFR